MVRATLIRIYVLIALGVVAVAIGTFEIGLPDPHLSIRNHHIQHVFFILGGGLFGIALAMGLTWRRKAQAWPGRGAWLAPAIITSLVVMIAMWPSAYSYIEARPALHASQHGLYLILSALATFSGYLFARSAGWVTGAMLIVMAWAAAFGFGVSPGPSPLIAEAAAAPATPTAPTEPGATVDGQAVYQNCVACHQAAGTGMAGVFPPLAGHVPQLLAGPGGREYVVHVLLYGMQGQISVDGKSYNGAMPPWGHLSSAELAAVLDYVSTSWDNAFPAGQEPFTAADFDAARAETLTPQQVHASREALGLR